jgi:Domain of unknown function (DUF305)
MSKILAISLILIAFICGSGAGYFLSPYYSPNAQASMEGFGTADKWLDLRFINSMIAHHRGAVLMAQNIQNKTNSQEIKDLSKDIQTNEPKLIDELYSWKKQCYNDYTPVRDPVVSDFGKSDEQADLRFLNALIDHHHEGVKMTKEIRTKSSRSEVLNNADAVEKFLTESGETLKTLRKNWYKI